MLCLCLFVFNGYIHTDWNVGNSPSLEEVMKIFIASEAIFNKEAREVQSLLQYNGHECVMTTEIVIIEKILDGDVGQSSEYIPHDFQTIQVCDVLLALNHTEHGIQGYIGGCIRARVLFAKMHHVPVRFLNNINPTEMVRNNLDVHTITLNGDASRIIV